MVRQAKPLGRRPGPFPRRPAAPLQHRPAADPRRQHVGTLVVLVWLALAVALQTK